jgi:hypothetical protein
MAIRLSVSDSDYVTFCNELHQEWKKHQFKDDMHLSQLFQLEFAPEPYFVLKNGNKPLYVLLTNPGSGIDFQRIDHHKEENYHQFQEILGAIYTSEAFRKEKGAAPAYRRLMKSIEFAEEMGFNGVVNIETIPFHSETLSKSKALKAIKESDVLFTYQSALKIYLKEKAVLIVSACGSKDTISKDTILKSNWLTYQCDLAGISVDHLISKPLTTKNSKITSTLFSHQNKHLVLMMGSNNLPKINK